MQQFVLVRVVPGAEPEVLSGYGPYADGREAAREAKNLSGWYDFKVQPRPIGEMPDWRPREAQRRAMGFYFDRRIQGGRMPYTPIPEGFGMDLDPDHCALVYDDGEREPTISFFESDTKARLDQRTELKTGRYLKRYFPDIPDERLKRLVAMVDPPVEVLFATTREEIRKVYVEGPDSCMSMSHRHEWDGLPCHPVEAYAGGDLAVAHILRQGRITARALCWPARRQHGRLYGDKHRLSVALHGLGYRQVDLFDGARMLRIPATRQIDQHRHLLQDRPDLKRDGFLVPYLDNVELLLDRGDHLVTAKGPIRDRDVRPHAHGGIPSVSFPAGWCDRLAHWVDGPIFRVRGLEQTWSQRALYDSDIYVYRCDATREFWPVESRYLVGLYDGRNWCREHFEVNGFVCALSGRNCPNEDRTERDGKPVSRSYLREQEERDCKLAQSIENERARREGLSRYDLAYGNVFAHGVGADISIDMRVQRVEHPRGERFGGWRRYGPGQAWALIDDPAQPPVVTGDELRDEMDLPVSLGDAAEAVVNAAVTNANRPFQNQIQSYAEVMESMSEALSRPYRPAQDFVDVLVNPPAPVEHITLEARPGSGWGVLWDDPIPEPEPDPRRRPWHALVDTDQIRSTRQGRRQQRRRG